VSTKKHSYDALKGWTELNEPNQRKRSIALITGSFVLAQLLVSLSPLIFSETLALVIASLILYGIAAGICLTILTKKTIALSFESQEIFSMKQIVISIAGAFLLFFTWWLGNSATQALFGTPLLSNTMRYTLAIIRYYPYYLLTFLFFLPILEEIVFRKIVFGILVDRMGGVNAALLSSLVFAFFQSGSHFFTYGLIGVVLCLIYYKSESLWSTILSHILFQAVVFSLYLF
jgi:hypothetical protein